MKINIAYIYCSAVLLLFPLCVFGSNDPPVGYAALAGFDHLWQWNGKVKAASSSSTDPVGLNKDYGNFHGKYNGENVLACIKGPGCIYRIWSAKPAGTLKVYLDNELNPEIDCGFLDYLLCTTPNLPRDFCVGAAANYMPIPFKKSVIVTATDFIVFPFYQVNYQTYDMSVNVESFKKNAASDDQAYFAAKTIWAGTSPPIDGLKETSTEITLSADTPTGYMKIEGTGIIRSIRIKDLDNSSNPLDDVGLEIYWDKMEKPAVKAPLDAFFINRYNLAGTWPAKRLSTMFISAGVEGYESAFPMPFSSKALIKLTGTGSVRHIEMRVMWGECEVLPENTMRFHASYNQQSYELNKTPQLTFINYMKLKLNGSLYYNALKRMGRGYYVGCALFVQTDWFGWWGEGNEVIYIDGSFRPKIEGTGTEDDFNWSWGLAPNEFLVSGGLPAYPACNEDGNASVSSGCAKISNNILYRFRPSDYVPFNNKIDVNYQVWPLLESISSGTLTYASIAYWYEEPSILDTWALQ